MWPRWRLPAATGGVANPGAVCDPLLNPVRVGETEAGRAPSVLPRVPPLRGGLRQVEALQATIPAPYKRGQGEHRLGKSPPKPKSLQLLPTSTHSTSSSTKTHLRSMPPPPWVASTIPDAGPSASRPVPARPGRGVTGPRSLALQDREGGGQGRAGQPGEGADSGRTLPPPRPRRAEKRGAVKSPGGGWVCPTARVLAYVGGGGL